MKILNQKEVVRVNGGCLGLEHKLGLGDFPPVIIIDPLPPLNPVAPIKPMRFQQLEKTHFSRAII